MEGDNNPIKEVGNGSLQDSLQQNNNQGVNSKKVNNCALLSFIFSLVGLIVAGLPCGIVAVITGIIGLVKFNPSTEKSKWMAVTGLIIGVVDIVFVIIAIVLQTINPA